ncbi:hypothetical protein Hamer_G018464 [Homarus americanus]|uniref:Uncharacterized protein n=1 Tax=Homarus americanus TaxID=6706 RepID=A0A8J5K531_HOMAM|nr:hypothetical protein Hamer_G018464 [Homarus americanus]
MQAKLTANQQPFTSAADIATVILQECLPSGTCSAAKSVTHDTNYYRRKHRPKHPNSLDSEVESQHSAENFLHGDILVDDLIFPTDDNFSCSPVQGPGMVMPGSYKPCNSSSVSKCL